LRGAISGHYHHGSNQPGWASESAQERELRGALDGYSGKLTIHSPIDGAAAIN
jgi:hypothetical protein